MPTTSAKTADRVHTLLIAPPVCPGRSTAPRPLASQAACVAEVNTKGPDWCAFAAVCRRRHKTNFAETAQPGDMARTTSGRARAPGAIARCPRGEFLARRLRPLVRDDLRPLVLLRRRLQRRHL